MAVLYELIVEEDLNLGTGQVEVHMPGGGTVIGTRINLDSLPAKEGSATYDPASLADGAGVTTTVAVTGAALGDFAFASFSNALQGIILSAWVSATDVVSVRFQNESGGTLDLASGTLRARIMKA